MQRHQLPNVVGLEEMGKAYSLTLNYSNLNSFLLITE
jgi:hypothetical protein